jgi:CPA1 family monovalent cation:H+ antiporter
LLYRLAVGAAVTGHFTLLDAMPAFVEVIFGSLIAGWMPSWPIGWIGSRIDNPSEAVIFQFVMTFAAWLLAEHFGLSGHHAGGHGHYPARRPARVLSAGIRRRSFAVWETVTTILNVLAFVLIGLAIGPILRRGRRGSCRAVAGRGRGAGHGDRGPAAVDFRL